MAVKVVMIRVPRTGQWTAMNMILRELRMLAMGQPGYISGETLLSASNQGTTMVISTWAHVSDWKAYVNTPERKKVLAKLEPLLADPETTELWVESPVIG